VILDLKRCGMTVTLDDFGTGYSSLSYLAEMTFDKIKIDRSFVRTLRDKPQSAKIVDAIVGLSRSLGVDTVAEGVETEEEALALQQLGCIHGQGYLFGKPMRAQDLEDRIELAKNRVEFDLDVIL
jgi:EAL domain-containing protein (putative c-di-GMP-specific phosphodiesterase class I)